MPVGTLFPAWGFPCAPWYLTLGVVSSTISSRVPVPLCKTSHNLRVHRSLALLEGGPGRLRLAWEREGLVLWEALPHWYCGE